MISHVGGDLGVALDQAADGRGQAGGEATGGEHGDGPDGHGALLRCSGEEGCRGAAGPRCPAPPIVARGR